MPIYEYQCQKCKKIHEVSQKMADKPLTKCPDCKGKVQKLMSLSGFQLKGGGWYKDGYSTAKPDKANEGRSPSEVSGSVSGQTDGGLGGREGSPPAKKEQAQPSPSESPSPNKDAPPAPAKKETSDPKPAKASPRKSASKS